MIAMQPAVRSLPDSSPLPLRRLIQEWTEQQDGFLSRERTRPAAVGVSFGTADLSWGMYAALENCG